MHGENKNWNTESRGWMGGYTILMNTPLRTYVGGGCKVPTQYPHQGKLLRYPLKYPLPVSCFLAS